MHFFCVPPVLFCHGHCTHLFILGVHDALQAAVWQQLAVAGFVLRRQPAPAGHCGALGDTVEKAHSLPDLSPRMGPVGIQNFCPFGQLPFPLISCFENRGAHDKARFQMMPEILGPHQKQV